MGAALDDGEGALDHPGQSTFTKTTISSTTDANRSSKVRGDSLPLNLMRHLVIGGLVAAGLVLPVSTPAHHSAHENCSEVATRVQLEGCTATEAAEVRAVLKTLTCDLPRVDEQLDRNELLMPWPKGARAAFEHKLREPITIECQLNDEDPCSSGKIAGKVIPDRAPRRVYLCVERLIGPCDYARTVSHEIAHLAWSNGHDRACDHYFEDPSFSQAVGWATLLDCTPDESDVYDPEALKRANCNGSEWK